MSKFRNETLNPGEHFTYEGIEWICLDIINGNYLAVTAKPWAEIPFDTNNHNDWQKSSLRRVLNNDFLDTLDRKLLMRQAPDLPAGGTDYVTLLSYKQYSQYQNFIPTYSIAIWTLTPWQWYSFCTRVIVPPRYVSYSNVTYSNGVIPVCLFSSKISNCTVEYLRRL